MAIPVGYVVRIDILGSLFNQQIVTTFGYKLTASATGPDPVTDSINIAGDFKSGIITPFSAFLACCSPEYNADRIRCQVVYPERIRPGYNDVDLPGTNANSTDSTNQSATITRGGMAAIRSAIGAIHIPGLAATNMLAGNVNNVFFGLMGTIASRMLNTWTSPTSGALLQPVLINPARPAVISPPKPARPFDTQQLYFSTPQRTARVMRRRTIGVGK